MNDLFDITSPANPRVKRLLALGDRRDRDSEGVFLVEGVRLYDRAIASGLAPLEIYVDGSIDRDWDREVVVVHPDVLDKVSYRKKSEGVLAVFPQFRSSFETVTWTDTTLLLVVDSVEKPGNLGAVLRTADAVGADAVIEVSGSVDLFNPNLLRSSTGACFTVPVVVADVSEMASTLARRDTPLIAADPAAPQLLWDVDMTGPIALMVGSEAHGLRDAARSAATSLVRIPMSGSVDSLNASVALALLAYETLRQRRSR